VLLKIIYLLVCPELGLFVLMFRTDLVKDAERLVFRHEYAVLRRKAGRIRYESAERVRFAALAQLILRGRRAEVFQVTPATLPAWHRKLAAREGRHEQTAQAGLAAAVRSTVRTVIRLAKENPLWGGYRGIRGELTELGVRIAPSAVYEILQAAGIDPAPRRAGPTWHQFLQPTPPESSHPVARTSIPSC
jgi:hypothetical protein